MGGSCTRALPIESSPPFFIPSALKHSPQYKEFGVKKKEQK